MDKPYHPYHIQWRARDKWKTLTSDNDLNEAIRFAAEYHTLDDYKWRVVTIIEQVEWESE